jgi:hypothetical protein
LVGWCVVWIWAGFVRQLPDDSMAQVIAIGDQINRDLPTEATPVVGRMVYYWGLHDRPFYLSNTYIPQNVAPKVLIFTQGLDDGNQSYLDTIQTANLQLAGCYPAEKSGWRVLLYTTPEIELTLPERSC